MPEQPAGEKTLPASEHKKRKAREEGNVAKSQDLNSGWALLIALLALRVFGPDIYQRLVEAGRYFFGHADILLPTPATVQELSIDALARVGACVLPFMGVMALAGVLMNFAQVGVLITAKPLQPKFERINPLTGMQRFVSLRTFVEFIKSILKLVVIGYIVWLSLRMRAEELVALMELTPRGLAPAIGALVMVVWWRVALAMLILGILDYGFQRWQHNRDLMMTVQEAREEAKEFEGDPKIKSRVRQIQRQMAMQRMMGEVPTADVVVTNPTTYAVALRYDIEAMTAPTVIAKGARLVADKIRETAVEHDVPVVRKPELARTMYRTIEVGQTVPEELFRAVAEILAYVYEIDRREDKVRERRRHFESARQPA